MKVARKHIQRVFLSLGSQEEWSSYRLLVSVQMLRTRLNITNRIYACRQGQHMREVAVVYGKTVSDPNCF
jgi:hypothetical protein